MRENTIYLDIETIPSQEQWVRADIESTIEPPKTLKKTSSIEEWHKTKKEGAVQEKFHKCGFEGATNHIITIGWAFNNDPVLALQITDTAKERDNLLEFYAAIADITYPTFVGHNITSFDLRVIRQRSIILGVEPPTNMYAAFAAKPWDKAAVFDTMTQWSPDRQNMISQDKLAKALGFEGKKGMTGADVYPAWQAGEFERIAEYCQDDVETVRKIHKAMTFSGDVVKKMDAA